MYEKELYPKYITNNYIDYKCCFFLITFFYEKIIFSILSIPFITFVVTVIHELGHLIGCLITKTKIVAFRVFFLEIDQNGVHFSNQLYLGGSMLFSKNSTNKKIIYLMGPIMSLLIFVVSLVINLITLHVASYLFVIISLLSVILVSIPFKGTDIYNFFKTK